MAGPLLELLVSYICGLRRMSILCNSAHFQLQPLVEPQPSQM